MRSPLRNMLLTALFAALTAVGAFLRIPLGYSSFTLQVFFTCMAGVLLGPYWGAASQAIYVLLGLVGLPVFAGFSAGAGALLGVTGGYLIGFLASALVYWAVTAKLGTNPLVMAVAMVLGLVVCYAFGTVWFIQVYTSGGNATTLLGTLGMCVFPYIIPDLIKIALALLVAKRVGNAISL